MAVRTITTGPNQPDLSKGAQRARMQEIRDTVEHYIPEFANAVKFSAENKTLLIMHQDAFAAGFHEDEYILLAMAVKYAGMYDVRLQFIGKARLGQ